MDLPRNDDHGYIIGLGPFIEVLKTRIQLNVYTTGSVRNISRCKYTHSASESLCTLRMGSARSPASPETRLYFHTPLEKKKNASSRHRSAHWKVTRPDKISRFPSRRFSFPKPRLSVISVMAHIISNKQPIDMPGKITVV